jgi:hypothetical protein
MGCPCYNCVSILVVVFSELCSNISNRKLGQFKESFTTAASNRCDVEIMFLDVSGQLISQNSYHFE